MFSPANIVFHLLFAYIVADTAGMWTPARERPESTLGAEGIVRANGVPLARFHRYPIGEETHGWLTFFSPVSYARTYIGSRR